MSNNPTEVNIPVATDPAPIVPPTISTVAPVAAVQSGSAPAAPAVRRTPAVTSSTAGGRSKKKKKSQSNSGEGAAGENTGRWTAEEHRLFLQGLEQHGKGWTKIASLIKSRTVVQVR